MLRIYLVICKKTSVYADRALDIKNGSFGKRFFVLVVLMLALKPEIRSHAFFFAYYFLRQYSAITYMD